MYKKTTIKEYKKPLHWSIENKTNYSDAFELLFARYKSGAYRRYLKFNLTKKEFEYLTEEDCHYCGIQPHREITRNGSIYKYNGIDRIDSNEGYIMGNVTSCCNECNMMKNNTPYDEFLEKVRMINNRLNSNNLQEQSEKKSKK